MPNINSAAIFPEVLKKILKVKNNRNIFWKMYTVNYCDYIIIENIFTNIA